MSVLGGRGRPRFTSVCFPSNLRSRPAGSCGDKLTTFWRLGCQQRAARNVFAGPTSLRPHLATCAGRGRSSSFGKGHRWTPLERGCCDLGDDRCTCPADRPHVSECGFSWDPPAPETRRPLAVHGLRETGRGYCGTFAAESRALSLIF